MQYFMAIPINQMNLLAFNVVPDYYIKKILMLRLNWQPVITNFCDSAEYCNVYKLLNLYRLFLLFSCKINMLNDSISDDIIKFDQLNST